MRRLDDVGHYVVLEGRDRVVPEVQAFLAATDLQGRGDATAAETAT